MNKDELKKEAEEYWFNQPPFTRVRDRVIEAYLASAELREKRIADLEQENALARELLGKWHGQHSEKGYTETFYQNLLRETEKLLWGNANER